MEVSEVYFPSLESRLLSSRSLGCGSLLSSRSSSSIARGDAGDVLRVSSRLLGGLHDDRTLRRSLGQECHAQHAEDNHSCSQTPSGFLNYISSLANTQQRVVVSKTAGQTTTL